MANAKNVTTDETVEEVKVPKVVRKVKEEKPLEDVTVVCKKTGTPLTIDVKTAQKIVDSGHYLTWEEAQEKELAGMVERPDGIKVRTWEILRQPIVYTVDRNTGEPILVTK